MAAVMIVIKCSYKAVHSAYLFILKNDTIEIITVNWMQSFLNCIKFNGNHLIQNFLKQR